MNGGKGRMKTFTVSINETNYGFVEVQAKTAEEAKDLAMAESTKGNIIWCNTDTEVKAVIEND